MNDPLHGEIIDAGNGLTLEELCSACGVQRDHVLSLIDEGVLRVEHVQVTQWRFAGNDLSRVLTAMRLQRDLDVNLAGVGLAIQLLEEIEDLRRQLRHA
jgi:chaperone modulatory protein CbpM